MKWTNAIKGTFKGMGQSISRFPLTSLFLVAIAGLNAMTIEQTDSDFTRLIFTFVIGAMLGVVGQMLYERFGKNETLRYGLFGGAAILTLLYYFIIGPQHDFNLVLSIKTFVAMFALGIAFIWIPTIKNEQVPFHRSFLAILKAFFTTFLFTLVLAGGISAIFSATDYLLFDMDYDILSHLMNIVVSLFAPIYFLSLTPIYPGTLTYTALQDEKSIDAFSVPRFLEVLISYIVIPLVAIYTLILIVYVGINFTGDFWTDNLLEPLLVSYAIIVIVVLILSYNIENRLAIQFRQIFPKVLLPIVIFQTIASILKIGEMGITHGRYYVILFGLFATITGVIFGFFKEKHHGYIALVLLILSTISIVPPVDAFTISRRSQVNFLEEVLADNDMLEDNQVTANNDIPVEDKMAITKAVDYLLEMDYQKDVSFLPDEMNRYNDFERVFGFSQTYSNTDPVGGMYQYVYLDEASNYVVEISEYDIMTNLYLISTQTTEPISFEVDGETFTLEIEMNNDYPELIILNSEDVEYISYSTQEIFEQVFGEDLSTSNPSQNLSVEEAQFQTENDQVQLNLLVQTLERTNNYNSIQFSLYIAIK